MNQIGVVNNDANNTVAVNGVNTDNAAAVDFMSLLGSAKEIAIGNTSAGLLQGNNCIDLEENLVRDDETKSNDDTGYNAGNLALNQVITQVFPQVNADSEQMSADPDYIPNSLLTDDLFLKAGSIELMNGNKNVIDNLNSMLEQANAKSKMDSKFVLSDNSQLLSGKLVIEKEPYSHKITHSIKTDITSDKSSWSPDPKVVSNNPSGIQIQGAVNSRSSINLYLNAEPLAENQTDTSLMKESAMVRLQNALNINTVRVESAANSQIKPPAFIQPAIPGARKIMAQSTNHTSSEGESLKVSGIPDSGKIDHAQNPKIISDDSPVHSKANESGTGRIITDAEDINIKNHNHGDKHQPLVSRQAEQSTGNLNRNNSADTKTIENNKTADGKISNLEIAANSASAGAKSGHMTQAKENAPVRFILPQDLKFDKADINRTIFIKLEPENLGTVRLTLTSHHDSISGRMVVDSNTARVAIEDNLNHLTNDLSARGIKLDSFQVSVGGGMIGQKHTSGKMNSSRRPVYDRNRIIEKNPVIASINQNRSGSAQYIGSTGVNWLA